MSRKWINLSLLIVSYALVVFLLATLVHEFHRAGTNMSVNVANCIVFVLPLFIATSVAWNLISPASLSTDSRRTVSLGLLQTALFPFICFFIGLIGLQKSDDFLADRYLKSVRQKLADDPRYQNIRILGLSRSFILFPYHPVDGTVASEEDRIILNRLLGDEWTPGFVSAITVGVTGEKPGIETYLERLDQIEKEKMEE